MPVLVPDRLFFEGALRSGLAVTVENGRIVAVGPAPAGGERLPGCALLPGFVNGHSHAFQRLIRGRTEWRSPGQARRTTSGPGASRCTAAATALTPEDVHAVSRMAFWRWRWRASPAWASSTTCTTSPTARPTRIRNELAHRVIAAAQRRRAPHRAACAWATRARASTRRPNPRQRRFIDSDVDDVLAARANGCTPGYADSAGWVGVAPHSVRAVPREWLARIAAWASGRAAAAHARGRAAQGDRGLLAEHGERPVALLGELGALDPRFTAVHAVHLADADKAAAARARGPPSAPAPPPSATWATASCDPDGRPHIALGTDSQVQIDLLEDARELEYHLRLQKLERAVLAPRAGRPSGPGRARLLACATVNGARSIGVGARHHRGRQSADFFTVDLDDPSIAGARPDDLLAGVVFSLERTAIRDVWSAARR